MAISQLQWEIFVCIISAMIEDTNWQYVLQFRFASRACARQFTKRRLL
jgi:hypothetical protein